MCHIIGLQSTVCLHNSSYEYQKCPLSLGLHPCPIDKCKLIGAITDPETKYCGTCLEAKESKIRERYRFKTEAMMNEIEQGGWIEIDTQQLNADIGTDMERELRALQQADGTNVDDEGRKHCRASGNDSKPMSDSRIAVNKNAGVGLRQKSTKGHVASGQSTHQGQSESISVASTRIPKGEFPWAKIDENRVKYANKPLPPTPTTAVQAEQARKRAVSKTGLYLLGGNPPIASRKEDKVIVTAGREQFKIEPM